jgi:hypothetical protein
MPTGRYPDGYLFNAQAPERVPQLSNCNSDQTDGASELGGWWALGLLGSAGPKVAGANSSVRPINQKLSSLKFFGKSISDTFLSIDVIINV